MRRTRITDRPVAPRRRRAAAWAAALSLLAAGPGRTAELTVNSAAGRADAVPGDGLCATGAVASLPGGPEPECTLRAAVDEANALPGADLIGFHAGIVPNDGDSVRITTSAPLVLAGPVSIAGDTAPGYDPTDPDGVGAQIHLDGAFATGHGVVVARSAPGTRLRGLAIHGFPGSGLVIEADDVTVQGCAIGLRADGSVDGNGGDGIGTSPTLRPDRATIGRDFDPALGFVGEGNVVVASGGHGIRLFGDDHRIAGNVVGSDASGSTGRIRGVATRNLGGGIWVSGARNAVGWSARAGTGTRHVSGNLVSGNAATGITVAGPRARIEGNRVGTTGTGLAALPNLGSGIDLRDASSPALRGNLVAGNAGSGVLVSPRSRPVLEDNRIGPSLDDQGGVGRTDTASGPLGSAGPS